jgi:hypothetical protein
MKRFIYALVVLIQASCGGPHENGKFVFELQSERQVKYLAQILRDRKLEYEMQGNSISYSSDDLNEFNKATEDLHSATQIFFSNPAEQKYFKELLNKNSIYFVGSREQSQLSLLWWPESNKEEVEMMTEFTNWRFKLNE